MKHRKLFSSFIVFTAARALVGCSGNEGPAMPVPVDSGAPVVDGASKTDAVSDQASPEGGAKDSGHRD
jgi:hypothetical protein